MRADRTTMDLSVADIRKPHIPEDVIAAIDLKAHHSTSAGSGRLGSGRGR
jgi:hypothetical protein